MSPVTPPYPYPNPNSTLIQTLNLAQHFEGGYFTVTVALHSSSNPSSASSTNQTPLQLPASAALEGRSQSSVGPGATVLLGDCVKDPFGGEGRLDATQIYYLLTPDSYRGKMHMNLHATFHTHHAGRALYTLIKPPSSPSELPEVRRIVMGQNLSKGEQPILFVPGGWWKASEIPQEDLSLLSAPDAESLGLKDNLGCLISEVVVPGWNPDQHQFIDEEKLKAMWNGQPGWEAYVKYIQPPHGLMYPDK